jgi:hypothetical protein
MPRMVTCEGCKFATVVNQETGEGICQRFQINIDLNAYPDTNKMKGMSLTQYVMMLNHLGLTEPQVSGPKCKQT